jgi:hypothetical protein
MLFVALVALVADVALVALVADVAAGQGRLHHLRTRLPCPYMVVT